MHRPPAWPAISARLRPQGYSVRPDAGGLLMKEERLP